MLTTKEGSQLGHDQRLLLDKGAQEVRGEAWRAQLHLKAQKEEVKVPSLLQSTQADVCSPGQ
jgi:hypothetical protein